MRAQKFMGCPLRRKKGEKKGGKREEKKEEKQTKIRKE
jgi:hypothetical protein